MLPTVFVLSHPNGWALDEQTVMRSALSKAAPRAKLNESTASDRVIFVSEAEAAVHFSLHYTSSSNSLDSWLAVSIPHFTKSLKLVLIFVVFSRDPNL